MTPDEVADMLRVSVVSVKRWARTSRIDAVKVASLWRIPRSEALRLAQGGPLRNAS